MADMLPRTSLSRRVFVALVLAVICFMLILALLSVLAYWSVTLLLSQSPAGRDVWNAAQRLMILELQTYWPVPVVALLVLLLLFWWLARWTIKPVAQFAADSTPLAADVYATLPRPNTAELALVAQSVSHQQQLIQQWQAAVQLEQQQLQLSNRRLEGLLQISKEIGGMLDAEQSLRRMATLLTTWFGFERAAAALVERDSLVVYCGTGPNGQYEPPMRVPLNDRSALGRAVLHNTLQHADDLHPEPSLLAVPGWADSRTELVAPVTIEQDVTAALIVQSRSLQVFGSQHEVNLIDLASQLAVALANSGRFRGEQSRRQLAEAVYRVSQTLGAALAPENVTELILDQLAFILPFDRGVLLLTDGEYADVLIARGCNGWSARTRLALSEYPLIAFVANNRRAITLTDATINRGYRTLPGGGPTKSWLGAPLVHQGKLAGVLVLENDQPSRYREDDVQTIAAITGQTAVLLENIRLSARAQELSRQLEVVSSVTQLVNTRDASRGLPGLLRTIIHQIRQVVPCDLATVALYNDDYDAFTVETVYDFAIRDWSEPPPASVLAAYATPWEAACNNHAPIEQPELARSMFASDRELAERGLQCGVVVPIRGGDRSFGALNFASRQPGAFHQAHVTTLLEISRQLGTMLHKERLAREREEAAAELARSREHLNMVDKVRLVGQLASGVAHDFNNLLAGVLGNAQLLLFDVQDPDQRDMLQVIERAAKDGIETVRRIQSFAKVQPEDRLVEVRMDLLARDAIDITRPRWRDVAQSRGAAIAIMRDIHPVPSILGRSGELREVLSNLIINAADAMPHGGSITVAVSHLPQPDQQASEVLVSVTDTGTGIPPEVRSRIFEPFFTTKGEKGTGLGLPVSLSIVQRHGGTIEVESEVGSGSTFRLRLPVRTETLTAPVEQPTRRSDAPMRPARLLLVESEAMIRVALTRLFHYWGHQVVEADCATAALAQFAPQRFDLVVCDTGMSDMSGYDLLARLRTQDPALKTVLLTGWGRQNEDLGSGVVDEIVEKPFDQAAMRSVLAALLPPI